MKYIMLIILFFVVSLSLYVSLNTNFISRMQVFAQGNQQIGTIKLPVHKDMNRIWLQECKPAIYLYPEMETAVHVKVEPLGVLTKTIPKYPQDGWRVIAKPDGQIISGNHTYHYLYYESKLLRDKVPEPTQGYVVPEEQLQTLYAVILPQLGLNTYEAKDFADYWQNALPQSPYYFVGVVDPNTVDQIEPLTITPQPDALLRVRIYFKPLQFPIRVNKPTLQSRPRTGFTAVEWGGIVDRGEKDFVCSE